MREHKYRAYDKESEIMIYSDGRNKEAYPIEYEFTIVNGSLACRWIEDYDDIWGDSQTEYGELDNIMQYTGLNDCKGNEIYENDICVDSQGDVIQIVWSKLYQWGCKIIKTENVLSNGLIFPLWQWDKCKENGYRTIEKVGNIYDNPEMVEGC